MRTVFTALLFSTVFHNQLLAQPLSDYELKAKIDAANPRKSPHERALIFACHKYEAVCQELDTEFQGLKPAQVTAYMKKKATTFAAIAAEYESGKRKIGTPDPKPKPGQVDPDAPNVKSYFLVRRSLEDISTLSKPKDPKDSVGAQFSYGRDNVSPNTVWSARGVVAVPFYITEAEKSDDRYAIGKSVVVAPFASFDKLTNSSASLAKTNLNNLTLGLISEAAVTNVGREQPVDHYFRLNSGVNMDFEGHMKSWYARAEWRPVSTAAGLNAPIDALSVTGFNFSPIIKVRAEYIGKVGTIDQPIFAARNDALRVGPLVGIEVQPVLGLWPDWFNSFTLVATYGYFYDTLSNRNYSLFDSALNYNIDKDGNYALSASYRQGRLEETGSKVDQIMLGLAVKFNQLPSVTASR